MKRWLVFACLLPLSVPDAQGQGAELVVRNANVVTMDATLPRAEAVACRNGRIVFVGAAAGALTHIGPNTRVLDLAGKTVVPGFIEGHAHFVQVGTMQLTLNLSKAKDWDEIVALVREAATERPAGSWILGRGWHQEKWDAAPTPSVEGCPVHDGLSRAVPDHPVLLTHASGHMSFANAKAMEIAGITADTPDPRGGTIVRGPDGSATGVFRETAASLIRRHVEEEGDSAATFAQAVELATRACLENGITSFHDAGSSFGTVDLLKRMDAEGRLGVRLWIMLSADNGELARRIDAYTTPGAGSSFLKVGGIKRFMDGALGSHGAWLIEPYSDLPDSTGLQTSTLDSLRETAEIAAKHNVQLCIHAIGDRANREVLDLYEEIFAQFPSTASRRWRIEHAQHIHPDDMPRFSAIGVVAAMQGIHCTSDAVFVVDRLGERRARESAYPWQALLRTGATIVNGTDGPVEDIDTIACFYASVTRRLDDGTVFFPEHRMTREQALRSYTLDAAYGASQEDEKGSITAGKLADMAVLSQDFMTCPEDQIRETEVLYTIVGGKVAYNAQSGSE